MVLGNITICLPGYLGSLETYLLSYMVLTKRFLPYPAGTSPSVCLQIDLLPFWVLLGTTQKKYWSSSHYSSSKKNHQPWRNIKYLRQLLVISLINLSWSFLVLSFLLLKLVRSA